MSDLCAYVVKSQERPPTTRNCHLPVREDGLCRYHAGVIREDARRKEQHEMRRAKRVVEKYRRIVSV